MAKKPSPVQMATAVIDGTTGWIGVFSSGEGAQEAADTLGSHVGRKLDVFPVPFWYDRLGLEDLSTVLQFIKPENGS